jgi:5-(carboxyamino)imidazole ribonucleotide synthase
VIIGIIGAGQLGRMLALAAYPLGLECLFYDRAADAPGGQVGPLVTGEFDDTARLREFAARVDVITFDWENIPVESVRALAKLAPLRPPALALERSQDRLLEKCLFRDLGIPTAPFAPVDLRADLRCVRERLGLPGVLKTRRFGYDGKGQALVRTARAFERAFARLEGHALLYEGFVPFLREVSLLAARARSGATVFYPLTENRHEGGVLAVSRAPYRDAPLQRAAERYMRRLLDRLGYVGVLCIEFFVTPAGLIANEMAPRVHNSGHWTIEGAVTSQFENHVRAIAGLPLGDPSPVGHAAMVNFLGRLPEKRRALALPGVHLHDYGKSPRPGRKLGHATVVCRTPAARDKALGRLLGLRRR